MIKTKVCACTRCKKEKAIQKTRQKGTEKQTFCAVCWRVTQKDEGKVKRAKVRAKKAETITEKKLDSLQSKVIRELYGNKCCTCGQELEFSKLHNGHFQSRRFRATRFNPENCASQCPTDNLYFQGLQYEFGLFMNRFHGEGTAEKIIKLSKSDLKIGLLERQKIYRVYQEALIHKNLKRLIKEYYEIFI